MLSPAYNSDVIVVHNGVPFGDLLHFRLKLDNVNLQNCIHHDRFEDRYLAWEIVRKARTPFFVHGTGFEGYFVGICQSPEEALDRILTVNQNILEAIARMYRFEYGFRSRLMKTLMRERNDTQAIHIWSAYLGSALARLRSQIAYCQKADQFRNKTYEILRYLPAMCFEETDGSILQTYAVRNNHDGRMGRLEISFNVLNGNQQDAWLIAENIGQFGHPLVRQFLDVV